MKRGIKDDQQRSSQTGGNRAGRGREHAGRSGEEAVQELVDDAELREVRRRGNARRWRIRHEGVGKRLKKAARYLKGAEKVTWAMRAWEDDEMKVDVRVDSEIGRKTREEVDRWRHETLVTQATRALGTAEAESYAVVTGSAEALGKQSMMTDLGMSAQVRVWTDSNAAKAIGSRRGFGKTRHVELKFLWLQEATKSGRVRLKQVPGEQKKWRTS